MESIEEDNQSLGLDCHHDSFHLCDSKNLIGNYQNRVPYNQFDFALKGNREAAVKKISYILKN